MKEYDAIVIGSGQAGGPLSWRLAGEGRKVALVEKGHLGGTCVNTGCTPSKTFIASAEAAHRARTAGELGIRVPEVRTDMEAVAARVRDVVETWRAGVAGNVEDAGENLRLIRGHARFLDDGTVDVEGERLSADTVIVNTGARPRVPPVPGLDGVPWLDHAAALELTELPRHLLVVGGGYIGCELGQAFRRLGSEVTIVQSGPHLMDREDEDVSEALEEAFRDEGIALRLERRAEGIRREGEELVLTLSDGTELGGSHLLVAVGRVPNTDDLGCDAAGIERDERGFIQVDERYRTSAEGIYAVGDCTGGPQFTHSSWDDHRILFDLLHGDDRRTREDRLVPHGAFTDPQVARVGLSEREARERHVEYEVATLPFAHVARARETGRPHGLIKVLVDPGTQGILGATVVGAGGNELIGIFQMLMMADAPATALVDAEMIHPTFAEGLQSALMSLGRYTLS